MLDEVIAEMQRQDEIWGPQRKHSDLYWLGILVEEVGELSKAIIESRMIDRQMIHTELVQVAAVACQWLRSGWVEDDDVG